MANDRIFIKCRHCNENMTFAKYYPTIGHGICFKDSLDEFVYKHMQCSPEFGKADLGKDRCFDLFTEG